MARAYTIQRFLSEFPSDDACLDRIMEIRYGPKPICPKCNRQTKFHRLTGRRAYSCQFCAHHVYPCVGTPFEKSTTPLHKWFYAMFLFTTSRNGVSARELQRHLGVTYKTAWRMAHQIREHMREEAEPLSGVVEADETFLGGKTRGRNWRSKKITVFGIKERSGNVRTQAVNDTKRRTLEPIIEHSVQPGSVVNTDELESYSRLGRRYFHVAIAHNRWEWARGRVTTNSIEGYWSLLKRGIRGTYIHVSKKHIGKYLAEFEFRHNMRKRPKRCLASY